ncbi:hypothetical protein [Winogradskyella vidalii]|uniref:hypothetical protein n=1 Tax=Winogradskyella vidalii TaxID=2615024 RepID=UPI0015C90ACA|nr:hypothetical protein [Winogradskyella vidalii]
MKTHILLLMTVFLSVSCSGQHNESKKAAELEPKENVDKMPKGNWQVDKAYDENGNLIRYDSIYSWSSVDDLNGLSATEKDSLIHHFKSEFYTNLSGFKHQGFEDVFSQDSLFNSQFFNDDFFGSDFGKDFMNLDKIRQQMIERQKAFLEKYQSEFIKPEDED